MHAWQSRVGDTRHDGQARCRPVAAGAPLPALHAPGAAPYWVGASLHACTGMRREGLLYACAVFYPGFGMLMEGYMGDVRLICLIAFAFAQSIRGGAARLMSHGLKRDRRAHSFQVLLELMPSLAHPP